ncbi:MAG: apolipoprotein N-acyltransferase, partial [Clostridia bacterium]|nr:apolipoprotein N-acyltransferase [Clostridia bacterium]
VIVFSWFTAMYPLEFTGLSKAAAVAVVCAGCIGLSLLQAIFWSFMFTISMLFDKLCHTGKHPLVYSLVFSCLYVVFEWMSTKTWAAVPWGRLAVGQTEFSPMVQIASVTGSYGVSFILVLFGCVLGTVFAEYRKQQHKVSLRPVVVAAVILVSNIVFGCVRVAVYEVPDDSTKVTVAAVQGNISSHDKWTTDTFERTKESYTALTLAAAGDGAKIAIFPETPVNYNIQGSSGYYVNRFYETLADESDCVIITGAFTKNDDGISENSIVVFDPEDGRTNDKYVKRHLVPFGEYVPLRDLVSVIFPPLSSITMLESDLAPGEEAVVIDTEYGRVAPLICFDSIYETLAIDSVRAGGELLTVSTNDSWFLDSAGVWEHNRHSVLRSIECGRYTVRAANTGVSSVISPTGDIMDILPPLEDGYIVTDVYMIEENTVYVTVGNVFVILCFAGLVPLLLYSHSLKKKQEICNEH